MACNSIKGLSIVCGESLAGGASKVYIIAYKDLMKIAGTNDVYVQDPVTGFVNEIGIAPTKAFVEIGIYPKASNGYTSTVSKDEAVGYFYFTQTVTLQLRGLSQENGQFIKDAGNQPVVFIIKDKQGKYTISGLRGMLTMETAEGGMGLLNEDGQSLNLTFSGMENDFVTFLDPSLLPSLLIPGCELPTISVDPSDATIDVGDTATFSVTATAPAGGTLSYQWQLTTDGISFANIDGATSASYTTPTATALMDGNRYRVRVMNSGTDCGTSSLFSATAILTVE